MKKLYVILCLLISGATYAQAPLIIEDFNYTAGAALTASGWQQTGTSTTAPIVVTTPGLTFTGYVGSGIGLAAGVVNTGQDVNKQFTEVTSGSVYTSFLVNAASNTGVGGYFFHYYDPAQSTAFRARTFIFPRTGKMMIGLSFNASAKQDSSLTLLNFGETYLFVLKYTIVDGVTNDKVSLFVFKAGDNFSTEPATPTLGPLTATPTTPTDPLSALGPDIKMAGIGLRQFETAQGITVDGIRVKTTWSLAQDASAAALSVSATTLTIAAPANSTKTFDITSNTSWTAASNQTWLTVGTLTGTGNATVTLTAAANPTTATRVATITVSGTGVTAQTITVTQDGSTTGIGEISNKQFTIYPNPVTNGVLNISSPNNFTKQIEIFDAIGKMIWSEQTSLNTIDVSGLNTGVYIIKVKDGKNMSTSKFIIK